MTREVWLFSLTALILIMVGREIKGDMRLTLSSLPDISSSFSSMDSSSKSNSSDNNAATAEVFTVPAPVEGNIPSLMVTAEPDITDNARPNHIDMNIPQQGIMESPSETVDSSSQRLHSSQGSEEALQFVHSRREVYDQRGLSRRWKMRGIGYLYSYQNMVLKASSVPTVLVKGRNTIVIENVHPNAVSSRKDCHLLTIWVRVDGPEIFSGMAVAVQPDDGADSSGSSCYWKFAYDLQVGGDYRVDAKMLVWNGLATVDGEDDTKSQCKVYEGNATQAILEEYPIHAGFVGFKLYSPTQSCCEICTRLSPYCQYWATPALGIEKPSRMTNGCELFFKKGTPEDYMPLSHLIKTTKNSTAPLRNRRRRLNKDKRTWHRRLEVDAFHGPPHNNPTSYFVGCGWSNWFTLDFPCESGDLDDRIYLAQSIFSFTPPTPTNANAVERLQAPLPLCTIENESLEKSNGRWVREPWPGADKCPSAMEVDFKRDFEIMKNDGTHPHCWHRDDLSRVGHSCVEMNCRFIEKEAKWISPLHEEKRWFGVWRPYDCYYLEFTDSQLQQCVSDRKITLMKTEGASIALYIRNYLELRLKNITMHDASDPDGIKVTIDTLKLLHLNGAVSMLENRIKQMPVVGKNEEYYWVTGSFLTSERETHVHVSRMNLFNQHVPMILEPKGYKMINTFDMSAGFAYETATQFDGMHFIGPTMKMLMTKVFHHICAETVEGNRL